MPYLENIEQLLGLIDQIPIGLYDKQMRIPLGTAEPYDSYPGEYPQKEIPKQDIIFWEMNLKEVFNILLVSWPGTHKTVLMKRILRYYYRAGCDCLAIDAKRDDMIEAKVPVNEFCDIKQGDKPERLLNEELPDSLPIYGCLPTFAMMRKSPKRKLSTSIVKKFDTVFAPQIEDIEEPIEWNTILGVKETGADVMMKYKNLKNLKLIKDRMNSDIKVHPSTKKSLDLRLTSIMADEVFDDKFPPLDISKLWEARKVPSINFYSRDKRYIRYIVGDTYAQMHQYSEHINRPKLIVCDDANFYASNREDYSTDMIINAIIHWRSYKFNQIFAVQNPSLIEENIISDCKHLFVGSLGKNEQIQPYLNNNIFDAVRSLRYDETRKPKINVEYIYIHPNKKTYQTFFPLGSILYHSYGG